MRPPVVAVFICLLAVLGAHAEDVVTMNFSADVAKMLHIIVHSLYQNPEIFVRELISNSADALTKYRVQSLTTGKISDLPMEIKIAADKDKRTFSIIDTGIGMTKQELIDNLGSLGASGTKKFLEQLSAGGQASKLIGQFGVGFYSVFLVGDNVKVASKHDNSTVQWVWESNADGKFRIYEDPRGVTLERGTEITVELKTDAEQYTEQDTIKKIIMKYSEFIDFPIYLQNCKTEKVPKKKEEEEEKKEDEEGKEGEDEKEEEKKEEEMEDVTKCDWEHVNEQKPIWMRNPADVDEADYNNFFKALTKESEDPLWYSHFSAEGEVEFKSILYIPGKSPNNLFDPSQGLMNNIRLYVRRVFITDEFRDLLPRYLNFIRGVVDSDDLPLNVSREVLQENRLLKVIRKRLSRKALSMFSDIIQKDEESEKKDDEEKKEDDEKKEGEEDKEDDEKKPEKKSEDGEKLYDKFWKEFGKSLRLGVIEDASNRARLTKLLRYVSSKSDGGLISLETYVERMHESQKGIFYITGETVDKIVKSPLVERALAEDVEVLYMTDAIDEYVVGHITEFANHKLVNLAKAVKLRDETDSERKQDKRRNVAWDSFIKFVKDQLGVKVEKVVLSKRLQNTPAIIVSPEYGMTATMEKIMKAQALADGRGSLQQARKIFEINPKHSIIDELRRRWKENPSEETLQSRIQLLYDVALLQSGYDLDDVNTFSSRLHGIVKHDLNLDDKVDIVDEEEYPADPDDEEEENVDDQPEDENEDQAEEGADKDREDEL